MSLIFSRTKRSKLQKTTQRTWGYLFFERIDSWYTCIMASKELEFSCVVFLQFDAWFKQLLKEQIYYEIWNGLWMLMTCVVVSGLLILKALFWDNLRVHCTVKKGWFFKRKCYAFSCMMSWKLYIFNLGRDQLTYALIVSSKFLCFACLLAWKIWILFSLCFNICGYMVKLKYFRLYTIIFYYHSLCSWLGISHNLGNTNVNTYRKLGYP